MKLEWFRNNWTWLTSGICPERLRKTTKNLNENCLPKKSLQRYRWLCHLHGGTEEYHGASFQPGNSNWGSQKHKVTITTQLGSRNAYVLHRAGWCSGNPLELYLFRKKWVQISVRTRALLRFMWFSSAPPSMCQDIACSRPRPLPSKCFKINY